MNDESLPSRSTSGQSIFTPNQNIVNGHTRTDAVFLVCFLPFGLDDRGVPTTTISTGKHPHITKENKWQTPHHIG